jgi:hypothetical protein
LKRKSGDRPDANLGLIQLRWESWKVFPADNVYRHREASLYQSRWRGYGCIQIEFPSPVAFDALEDLAKQFIGEVEHPLRNHNQMTAG